MPDRLPDIHLRSGTAQHTLPITVSSKSQFLADRDLEPLLKQGILIASPSLTRQPLESVLLVNEHRPRIPLVTFIHNSTSIRAASFPESLQPHAPKSASRKEFGFGPFYIPATFYTCNKYKNGARVDKATSPPNRDPVHDKRDALKQYANEKVHGTRWMLQNLHHGHPIQLPIAYHFTSEYHKGEKTWATGYADFGGVDPHHEHLAKAMSYSAALGMGSHAVALVSRPKPPLQRPKTHQPTHPCTEYGLARLRHEYISAEIKDLRSGIKTAPASLGSNPRQLPVPSLTSRSKKLIGRVPVHVQDCVPSDLIPHPVVVDAFRPSRK